MLTYADVCREAAMAAKASHSKEEQEAEEAERVAEELRQVTYADVC
jgi:hypothetical protein